MNLDPEKVRAVAEFLRAIAWPLVAIVAGVLFREDLRGLAKRLRKGGGAEFDPLQQGAVPQATLTAIESPSQNAVAQLPPARKRSRLRLPSRSIHR